MRLGILGGTFDPIHYGHLLLAESCREQCGLDQVWFVPAAVPPHKQTVELSSAAQRIEMLELAIAGHEALVVSPIEIERGGVSYTVDTLEAVRAMHPDAELFLLMGADSLADLPYWHKPERICQASIPVAVQRPGSPPPDLSVLADIVPAERLARFQEFRVESPLMELSSSELRQRASGGQSLRYRTPRAVEKYIENERLYRSNSCESH